MKEGRNQVLDGICNAKETCSAIPASACPPHPALFNLVLGISLIKSSRL